MKKRILLAAMGFVLSLLWGSTVQAEEWKTVVLTNENELVYQQGEESMETTFQGMAPGDSRTLTIGIRNEADHPASFFVSGETLKGLEEINSSARGGAYEFLLSVGKSPETAVSLLNTIAGGYTSQENASENGLYEITELQDTQFLAELAAGEATNLYITLTLEGEGMDSTNAVDYANAAGQMAFQFSVYYDEEEEPVVIDEYVTRQLPDTVERRLIPTAQVNTGDTIAVAVLGGIFVVGVLLVAAAFLKRKAEKAHEQTHL